MTEGETETLSGGVIWPKHTGESGSPAQGSATSLRTPATVPESSSCLLSLPSGRDACPLGNVTTEGIWMPQKGVFFGSIPHHPQLSFWQPDLNQIGFSAFHNFFEQICGLREQIKSTFSLDIIKNMTCRLEMDFPGLGIISVKPRSLLLKSICLKKKIHLILTKTCGEPGPKSYLRPGIWRSGWGWATPAPKPEMWF